MNVNDYKVLFAYRHFHFKDKCIVENFLNHSQQNNKPIYIQDGVTKCRFCQKDVHSTTFKNKAHAIPELLGNKLFINKNNECDSCNDRFSVYENDLSNFLNMRLVVGGVRGKKGDKQYESIKKNSRLYHKDGKLYIDYVNNNDSIVELDLKNSQIKYNYDRKPYIPINVYKILVKTALSMLDTNEFKNFTMMRDYVLNDKQKIGVERCLLTFIPFHHENELDIIGLKNINVNSFEPSYLFEIVNGGTLIQVPLFNDDYIRKYNGKKVDILLTPISVQNRNKVDVVDLSSTTKQINKTGTVIFKFDLCKETKIINKQ